MDSWLQENQEPSIKFDNAHSKSIETLQFNPTNLNQFATGSHDFQIRLWDIEKEKQMMELQAHKAGVWTLAYSTDGQVLFSGSPDKSIFVWDVKSGKPISELKGHSNSIYWIQQSDNGEYFISCGQDGHLILWDARKFEQIKDLKSSMDIIYHTHISEKSKYFFSSDSLGIIKVFDGENFQEITATKLQPKKEKLYTIQSIDLGDSKYQLFVGQKNKCVSEYKFDAEAQTIEKTHESQVHFDGVQCLSIDKAKKRFLTGCRDGTARMWNIEKEKEKQDYVAVMNFLGHKEKVTAIEYHPSQKIVGTCSWDQKVHLYQIQ